VAKTAEDYAKDLIGNQAMTIIGLRAQLDAAQSRIQELEKTVFEMKGRPEKDITQVVAKEKPV